jgi:DNA-binding IclR family transcriptional regulator
MTPPASRLLRDNPVQAVAKAAEALDHLAANGELTVAALAEVLNEPRSSVYRLIGSLVSAGLVDPGSRRGTFRLGIKVFQLGSSVAQRFDERELALPVMERIHDATEETVFLCVRRDDAAICIEQLNGKHVQALALRVGGSLPLYAGAAPRTLLAFEPKEVQKDYIHRVELVALTRYTPTTIAKVLRILTQVRADGYAVSDQDVTIGIAALGAPIFDHTSRVRAALSISGVRSTLLETDFEAMRDLVVDGAAEVSALLGYQPNGRDVPVGS